MHLGCFESAQIKKLELLSAAPQATLTLLSYSPDFPRASKTRYTHAKHEAILLQHTENNLGAKTLCFFELLFL